MNSNFSKKKASGYTIGINLLFTACFCLIPFFLSGSTNLSPLINLAERRFYSFQYDEAIEFYKKILFELENTNHKQPSQTLDPLTIKIHLRLAQAEFLNGNSDQAKKILTHLSQQLPSDHPILPLISSVIKNPNLSPLNSSNPFEREAEYLYKLGSLQFHKQEFDAAQTTLEKINKSYPEYSKSIDSLYFAALSADLKNNSLPFEISKKEDTGNQYRKKIFIEYPNSEYAPEAYFTYYSYVDYLQGGTDAWEHLNAMPEKFPEALVLINAYYLMGIDWKRERKDVYGKLIHKKNLINSIDFLNKAETLFLKLEEGNHIPSEKYSYYVEVYYRCSLERALSNLIIANDSKGTKKEIYLKYALEEFQKIVDHFQQENNSRTSILLKVSSFPSIYEESLFGLAQAYMRMEQFSDAEKYLNLMLKKYENSNISRGYFLSRVFYEQGILSMVSSQWEEAFNFFQKSEDAGKGKLLSIDQQLDLKIQQSKCLAELNQLNEAMLLLSRVVNENAISALRLKAMYLRAELYEKQGRHELAFKQLTSLSRQKGEWAEKAKNKMDELYANR